MSITEKLVKIAENVPKVYSAGFEAGKAEGGDSTEAYNNGFIDGQKSEYDRFWDSFQKDDMERNCDYRYSGAGWTDNTFKPKYSMKPTSAVSMFRRNAFKGNMVDLFSQLGITLDFSECTLMSYAFYECNASRIGVVDCTSATDLTGLFGYAYFCEIIDEVILNEQNTFNNSFRYCPSLEEIRITGTIGQNGFNIRWSSKLTAASLYSIVNALSSTTTGLTITLPTTSEANYNANPPEDAPQTWAELIATRSNWTFAYL